MEASYDKEKLHEDYRQYREKMKRGWVTRDFDDVFKGTMVLEGTVGQYTVKRTP